MFGPARNIDGAGSRQATDQSADSSAGVPGRTDVRILKHDVTKSADATVWRGFRLGEDVDKLAARRRRLGAVFDVQSHAFQRVDHGCGIDGVAHHGVSDLERGGRRRRIAQHNDHIVHQLDAGRRGRYRRKQIEPPKNVLVVNLAFDLAKRDGYAQRRCATRIRHRTVCAVCNGPDCHAPSPPRCGRSSKADT